MAYVRDDSYDDYLAGKRVICSSGFINGTPPPPPPELHESPKAGAVAYRQRIRRTAAQKENSRRAAKSAWARRKGYD